MILLQCLLFTIIVSMAIADTLRVPTDFSRIQVAIDAAHDGDVILVAPGVYAEDLRIVAKVLELRSEDGPEVTVVDACGRNSVLTITNSQWVVVDGFTLTNGNASGAGTSNWHGGGIYCFASGALIQSNVVTGNIANSLGGGVFLEESSSILARNLINGNTAYQGGGAAFRRSDDHMTGNTVTCNNAFEGGGVMVNGLYGESSPLIDHNTILTNFAQRGAGIYVDLCATPSVYFNRIAFNEANLGGGMYLSGAGETTICNNIVASNSATNVGGGVLSEYSLALLAGNVIVHNSTVQDGAGLAISGPPEYAPCSTRVSRIVNCTIAGNVAGRSGGGLHCGVFTALRVRNTILWSNHAPVGPEISDDRSDAVVLDSDIRGGWPGDGNIDMDPLFVDAGGCDYHLRLGSPCTDRGANLPNLPDLDWEGDPRTIEGGGNSNPSVDIGADEIVPEVAVRFGTVNAAGENLTNVLFVNGSAGDRRRVVQLPIRSPLTVDLFSPTSGPDPARFAMYGWVGEPTLDTLTPQPHSLGVMGHATPLKGGADDQARAIWNNMGYFAYLGFPDYSSDPAPSVLIDRPQGLGYEMTVTFQGFIEDNSSAANGPVSITNAVVVKVE
jgi:hypothetical protein